MTFEQKAFGACDAEFMKKGNYCLYTCGRCPSGGQEEKGEKKVRACGCGKYGGANLAGQQKATPSCSKALKSAITEWALKLGGGSRPVGTRVGKAAPYFALVPCHMMVHGATNIKIPGPGGPIPWPHVYIRCYIPDQLVYQYACCNM